MQGKYEFALVLARLELPHPGDRGRQPVKINSQQTLGGPAQNTSLVVSITPRRCQALRPPIASFFCSSSRLTKPRPGTLMVRPSAKRS